MTSTPQRSPRTLTLRLPTPMNVANSRKHWRSLDREKKAYRALCDVRQLRKEIPPPPSPPFGRSTISSIMAVGARMDQDNLMARHKWALDWLQSRGYIVNDRQLEWLELPTQAVGRRAVMSDEYLVELTLTEL